MSDHNGVPGDHVFAEGWFKPFCLFHIYTYPSLLALFEIFFLNAIRRQVVSQASCLCPTGEAVPD